MDNKGIILEAELRDKSVHHKEIDLLDLTVDSDIDSTTTKITKEQPLLRESNRTQLRRLLHKLIEKLKLNAEDNAFYLYKTLKAHMLPLTNCAFNKSGDR